MMRRVGSLSRTAAGLFLAAGMCGHSHATVDPVKATAPRMAFVPPAPGTYKLQRIQTVANAKLVDSGGWPVTLASLTSGKITLLTFFYTYCVDPLGCPFAHATLAELRDRVRTDRTIAKRIRFVSISLDPLHDSPAVLVDYRKEFDVDPQFEWRFVTAHRVQELLPVLDDFGQDVSVEIDAHGNPTRTLHHMLKVFLIDASGEVREIYTLAFLHPQVIFNDILTLALAGERAKAK
ncbi:MAG: SCO family protein [Pseudomonadota bacterium]|nr:SCO family protein [Pseudomonadota bacterium]